MESIRKQYKGRIQRDSIHKVAYLGSINGRRIKTKMADGAGAAASSYIDAREHELRNLCQSPFFGNAQDFCTIFWRKLPFQTIFYRCLPFFYDLASYVVFERGYAYFAFIRIGSVVVRDTQFARVHNVAQFRDCEKSLCVRKGHLC